jgi:O2-independent ubiquinone biosynthesis protein UbiV
MTVEQTRLELTLGPVFFNWPADQWSDFYARIADEAPLDRVVIGESVCSKREPFRVEALAVAVERLERAGKAVAYATLALPTTKREVKAIAEMVEAGLFLEANDIATIHLLQGKAHICGPFLNIYNEAALGMHLGLGAVRVCLPPELSLSSIRHMAAMSDCVEVFAFGRPPLAISARCYHARAHGLAKDSCQFVCDRDPDGLAVDTLDGAHFLAANGVQTLGATVVATTGQLAELKAVGVASLRLSPQTCDMVKVAKVFRGLADSKVEPAEANAVLRTLALPGPLSDGYVRGLAGARLIGETDE